MKKNSKQEPNKIFFNEKEYEFNNSDLSDEGQTQYARANQLAVELMQMERAAAEKRFIINNYIQFVVDEIEKEKDVDEDDKK
jgi:uncharacterized protein (DUF2236 family)